MLMHFKARGVYVAGAILGTIGGVAVMGPVAVAAMNDEAPVQAGRYAKPAASAVVRGPDFPMNARGMTYGSGAGVDAKNPGPQLVAAYGTDGTFGYVRAKDRPQGPRHETPSSAPPAGYTIPLYAVDGVTIIGEFEIHAGDATADPSVE